MRILNFYALFFLTFILLSCQSKKSNVDTMKVSESKMIDDGFKKAIVVYSTVPGDCEYTLAVEGQTVLFDPINLEGKFQKSQEKVWVKFNPLRMPNRCDKANPIEIIEISSRN